MTARDDIDLHSAVCAAASPRRRLVLVTAALGADERALLAMLEGGGVLCLSVEERAEVIERALRWQPDIILFASKAPLAERVRWLVLLRERAHCPVVSVGACRDDSDELVLLEAGFDAVWHDLTPAYLLRSRIEALLRWRGALQRRGPRRWLGTLALDSDTLTARYGGRPVALTRAQVHLLHVLAEAPLQTLGRAQMAAAIVARGTAGSERGFSLRRVDALVSRLRVRLAELQLTDIHVEPVRGYGYRLRIDEPRAAPPAPAAPVRQALPVV